MSATLTHNYLYRIHGDDYVALDRFERVVSLGFRDSSRVRDGMRFSLLEDLLFVCLLYVLDVLVCLFSWNYLLFIDSIGVTKYIPAACSQPVEN